MDETTLAFEALSVRSVATSNGDPLDRISVRDHVRTVEIGAFRAERGVTQRIRFNVVLEVLRPAAALDDDVDKVVSYETIVEVIDQILGTERINLLETLAERVADGCLEDRRAVRVFVRVEKLDHISGTLGVEIARARKAAGPAIALVADAAESQLRPRVVFIGNDVLGGPVLSRWIDAIAASGIPTIICLEALGRRAVAASEPAQTQIDLLSIEQNAWVLSGIDDRCVVVGSRAELEWAMKHQQIAVWAPSKIVNDAVDPPLAGAGQPLDLAAWLAVEFHASEIVLLAVEAPAAAGGLQCRVPDLSRPETLAVQS